MPGKNSGGVPLPSLRDIFTLFRFFFRNRSGFFPRFQFPGQPPPFSLPFLDSSIFSSARPPSVFFGTGYFRDRGPDFLTRESCDRFFLRSIADSFLFFPRSPRITEVTPFSPFGRSPPFAFRPPHQTFFPLFSGTHSYPQAHFFSQILLLKR